MTSRAEPPSGAPASFVRALWGLEVSVLRLPTTADLTPRRPRFVGSRIWLPGSALRGVPGAFESYLLAAAAHVGAHRNFGLGARFSVGTLKPAQVAIISVLEDARVERLAIERYPGLASLWAPFHDARPGGAKTSASLLARLARALHDDSYDDDDGWVSKARRSFLADPSAWSDPRFVRDLGGRLGNDWGQMRVQFNARDYVVQPAYRDDNIGLWHLDRESSADGSELELEIEHARAPVPPPSRSENTVQRATPQPSNPNASADTNPVERAFSIRQDSESEPAPAFRYPEWDYVIQRERPAFTSVWERAAPAGNAARLDAGSTRDAPARRRLQRSASRLASQKPTRVRRLKDGDRLDLPAAIAALVARASGTKPDPRVYRRMRFESEPPALLLLLDCSESLNVVPAGGAAPILEQARRASALLAATLPVATPDWAIHGFSSNGRHEVGYSIFKHFDEPYDDRARARLAGMRAGLSTRLGSALRHAGRALTARRARRKLLLVVSDGEPSDVDVYDPKYLLFDAKRATEQNRARGVSSFCLGLDSAAESSLRCIFGIGNYVLTDRLEQLPELLGRLYLRLAG